MGPGMLDMVKNADAPAMPAAFTVINNDPSLHVFSNKGSALGFDFGEKRIGVAVGEHLLGIAHPLTTIEAEATDERFEVIQALVDEWNPSVLVVGLPCHMDGTAHAMTALSQKFARRLDGRFNLPVVMMDERLTSVDATHTLREAGIAGSRHKPLIDQVAAQHILQSYFDAWSSHPQGNIQ